MSVDVARTKVCVPLKEVYGIGKLDKHKNNFFYSLNRIINSNLVAQYTKKL